MDKSRPAAERVRPILQAMERSIDAARRRRLGNDEAPEAEVDARPTNLDPALPLGDRPARLKARPKRVSPFPGYDDGSRLAG